MTNTPRKDIALVGMACTLPPAVELTQFWSNLVNGLDSHAPSSTWRTEVQADDAAYRLLHDTIRQALQDAAMLPNDIRPDSTHVIVDGGNQAHAARMAEVLGPCAYAYVVDDTEPGALRALTQGVLALRQGQCDVAVVACIEVAVQSAAAVVLKRQADAETAGDSAYAFLTGMATTTRPELHQAYTEAAITPEQISLLEIRGQDSADGDPAWLDTITTLFGHRHADQVLRPLGAMNTTNDGCEAGLALISLIKSALCLNNKLIPASWPMQIGSITLNQLPFYLNVETRPWVHDVSLPPRRAAVHVQGPAESASHIILEEIVSTRDSVRPKPIKTELAADSELIVLSGDSVTDVAASVARLYMMLQGDCGNERLADVAYAQYLRFDPQARCRLAIVCPDVPALCHYLEICRERLSCPSPTFTDVQAIFFNPQSHQRPGKIAWVFRGLDVSQTQEVDTGQWLELCTRFPVVREVFDLVDRRDGHPEDPTPTHQMWFPLDSLTDSERQRLQQRLATPRLSDTASLEIPKQRNLALMSTCVANWVGRCLLEKLDVPVDMMFGQSHGELTALCAAGALDFPAVMEAHWHTEMTADFIANRGQLAVVSSSEANLAPWLNRYRQVAITFHVSPHLQILGGEAQPLAELVAAVRASGIWAQPLPYAAIHTPHFTSLRSAIEPCLQRLAIDRLRMPVYSGMTSDVYPEDANAIRQTMIANLDHPVLLWQTSQKLYHHGARIFIEMRNGSTLQSQATQADDTIVLPLVTTYRSAITQLHHLCAALLTHGVTPNLAYLYEHRSLKNPWPTEPQTHSALQDEPRMPFIGHITSHTAGKELSFERHLDLHEDHFLADHRFIHAEGIKPISACLPAMPMTASMEMMAEAAACLVPGHGLIGFEDVKAMRWIALKDRETLRLRVSAQLHHHDTTTTTSRIRVAIYVEDQPTPAAQATVLMGQQYHVNINLQVEAPRHLRRAPHGAPQIYQDRHLFHGPLFQCIAGEALLAEHAVIGELDVLSKETMFHSTRRPELLTDPLLLDGVGQLMALWAMEEGKYVFPIGIDKLELYRTTPSVGTRVPVYINITQSRAKLLSADVELQDGAGNVWMRIQGWRDWAFRWPKKVFDFRRQPTQYCPSHDVARSDLPPGAVARRIDKVDLRDVEADVMARYYLHSQEMTVFHNLAGVPERQYQWLLGRIAAKDAARTWLAQAGEAEMPHPAAFQLTHTENGHLVVETALGVAARPIVSIVHAEDRAGAVAHTDPIGTGIEPIVACQEHVSPHVWSSLEVV